MKKRNVIIIILLCLFIGILLGRPSESNIQEELKLFEENITSPSTTYTIPDNVEPNIASKIGKKGEDLIDKAFDFAFGILKKVIDD